MKTAIEELIEECKNSIGKNHLKEGKVYDRALNSFISLLENKYLPIEKQQIIEACEYGMSREYYGKPLKAEQYYKSKYE